MISVFFQRVSGPNSERNEAVAGVIWGRLGHSCASTMQRLGSIVARRVAGVKPLRCPPVSVPPPPTPRLPRQRNLFRQQQCLQSRNFSFRAVTRNAHKQKRQKGTSGTDTWNEHASDSSSGEESDSDNEEEDLEVDGASTATVTRDEVVNTSFDVKSHKKPHRVVFSGGPCAGKTTAMALLTDRLEAMGFRVLRVPEAATILINNGLSFVPDPNDPCQSQVSLMQVQLALEDAMVASATNTAAGADKPCVVLCDRGCMDGKAYSSDEGWEEIVRRATEHYEGPGNYTEEALRDGRYDQVGSDSLEQAFSYLVVAELLGSQFWICSVVLTFSHRSFSWSPPQTGLPNTTPRPTTRHEARASKKQLDSMRQFKMRGLATLA